MACCKCFHFYLFGASKVWAVLGCCWGHTMWEANWFGLFKLVGRSGGLLPSSFRNRDQEFLLDFWKSWFSSVLVHLSCLGAVRVQFFVFHLPGIRHTVIRFSQTIQIYTLCGILAELVFFCCHYCPPSIFHRLPSFMASSLSIFVKNIEDSKPISFSEVPSGAWK